MAKKPLNVAEEATQNSSTIIEEATKTSSTQNHMNKKFDLSSLTDIGMKSEGHLTQALVNDDDAKRFVHTLMERKERIQIEFKNHKSDGSPYIWVTSPRIEGGCSIHATDKNATWLITYLKTGIAGPIPDTDGEVEMSGHDDLGKDMLMTYLESSEKDFVKFTPLFSNPTYVKAKLHCRKGSINFTVAKTEKFVDWLNENKFAA